MKQHEAELLAKNGVIAHAVICRPHEINGWSVYLYAEEYADPATGAAIETARSKEPRIFASIDTAVGFIVALGGNPRIEVQP